MRLPFVVMHVPGAGPDSGISVKTEVVAIGHAIVDVLASVEDGIVTGLGLDKGTMTLVDEGRAAHIHGQVAPSVKVSGGSAANTAVGLVSLGGTASFVGKVRDDELGAAFRDDIRDAGVVFDVEPTSEGPATGSCVVMVTSDAERTMCTHLGIGDYVAPNDVDHGAVAAARLVYIEGYLCGLEHTDEMVLTTLEAARASGTQVALSLSDPFWIELHGHEIEPLLDSVDVLFANEAEACLLTGTDEIKAAVKALSRRCETVIVTRGPAGSVVSADGGWVEVAAHRVGKVVDTTGAGDLYAAGYLRAHLLGAPPEDAAHLGGLTAAEVITHMGARPARSLRPLLAQVGLEPS
jgi:sugar/nucleoside kinase (ribokinase family)